MYPEAAKAVVKVEGHQKAVTTLLVACSYEQDDLPGCRRQLDKWVAMQLREWQKHSHVVIA